MNVLFGCEESAKGRDAFAKLGHNAWSCDLEPSRKEGSHYQMDIMKAIKLQKWDLIILHPPCDYLALCGNRWYASTSLRDMAIDWTVNLWNEAINVCDKVCLENPKSVIFKHLKLGNTQYVHPWQFGHGETKPTGLRLYGLPDLIPTKIVDGREQRIWKMPPGKNRKRDRSESYQGIMDAMAYQWGNL